MEEKMPRKNSPHITPAELDVMKMLWQLGSGTVQQVIDALPPSETKPAYTTIMTMMKNLGEKGALEVDRGRQPFVYTPRVRREQVLRQRLASFVQTVFDGQAEDLMLHLVEESDLSAEDLRRIEDKIQKRAARESDAERGGNKR
jgi:BlaI family penicillinase repressor